MRVHHSPIIRGSGDGGELPLMTVRARKTGTAPDALSTSETGLLDEH
jgi:hypothetical protein